MVVPQKDLKGIPRTGVTADVHGYKLACFRYIILQGNNRNADFRLTRRNKQTRRNNLIIDAVGGRSNDIVVYGKIS